jgi:hypothetical protein
MSYTVWEVKDVLDALAAQTVKLDAILSREADLAKTLVELTADLAAKVADIKADAGEVKAAVAAAIALLNGVVAQNAAMKQQIADLIALNPTPEQLAALEAVGTSLSEQDAEIDAAVKALNDGTAANTGS